MLDPSHQETTTLTPTQTSPVHLSQLKNSIRKHLLSTHGDSHATLDADDGENEDIETQETFKSLLLPSKSKLESSLFVQNAHQKLLALDASLVDFDVNNIKLQGLMALSVGLSALEASDSTVTNVIEKAVLKWFQRVCALPDLKHVHYTGSADFSAGRLSPHEIQVYRTATFLCMGPHVDRITSASIPVFYIPSTLQESDPNHPEKLIKKYWALIGSPSYSPAAKIRRIPSVGPSSESIEISLLIAYLSEDVAVGRRPCVVVGRATSWSSVLGEWDDLAKIRDVCSRFGCWMHVECDNMSLLTAPSMTDDAETRRKMESLRTADSITFHASTAFKLTNPTDLPSITLFNTVDPRLMDPLHLDAFDTSFDKPSGLQSAAAASQRRRSSGSAGGALIASALRSSSAGGERISGEYQYQYSTTAGVGMSRSGSVNSVTSACGGVSGGAQQAVSPNSSKLLKRMSSSALFHTACYSMDGSNTESVAPVGLKYSLPWWMWSLGTWTAELMDAFQLGQELTEKLADRLQSVPDLEIFCNPSVSNYLTLLFRFNPTVSARGTLLTHPVPPVHISHVPEKPQSFIPKPPQMPVANSPWTPGYGTPESLMLMEQSRREAWGNKMNADLGTRFLFNRLSSDIKNNLQLGLVTFNGSTFIRYQMMSYLAESKQHHATLVEALAFESITLGSTINSTLKHQKTLQSLITKMSSLSTSNNPHMLPQQPHGPIELRYIPPSQVSQWKVGDSALVQEPFVGLGGLHFTPSYLDLEAEPIDEGVVKDLDALNECLAEALAGEDSVVFTKGVIGKGWTGGAVEVGGAQKGGIGKVRSCVRVGMDKSAYDEEKLEVLIEIVLKKGRELERGDQFLATLSDVIKRGIQSAEINLKKQVRDDEVSIFRSLPVIGTVLGFMGVNPSNSNNTEAIVSDEPESRDSLRGDFDVASLIESKVYGAASSEDVANGRRNAVHHHPRAVARSFTLSGGFTTIPIDEAQIIKMPTPAVRASIGSVSQVESAVAGDDGDLDVGVDGELEMEDFENGYLAEVDYDEEEYEEGNGDEKAHEAVHEVDGKVEFEEEEGGYVGDGEVGFVHNAIVAQEVDGFVEEDGGDSDLDV
ncbi:UNVERIFIED_CONTAM: Pyridoxal-dependent decarboxylase domain-containing protein 1 [Siphonaria sp. JEL0065]|nr:Pyridoxal-dependent decarboxylase domain-containing protein 1 [Siphonaria sp. JEL0065]